MPSMWWYVDIPFWVIQSIQWYISNSTFTCHTSINIPHLYSIHGFPWGRICTNLTINVSLTFPWFLFPICWWPQKFRLFFWCPVAGNWTVSTPSTDHSWAIRWSKVISGTPTPQSISMLRTNLSPHRWDHAFYPFFERFFYFHPMKKLSFSLELAAGCLVYSIIINIDPSNTSTNKDIRRISRSSDIICLTSTHLKTPWRGNKNWGNPEKLGNTIPTKLPILWMEEIPNNHLGCINPRK